MRRTEALRLREDIHECKNHSFFYNKLSPANKALYAEKILSKYGLLPEQEYANTQRLGANNDSGVRQNNKEHVRDGFGLINQLKRALNGHWTTELPKDFWDNVELGWGLHDIGEWGMKHDITTDLKSDQTLGPDDIEEKIKAQNIIAKLEDGDFEDRCQALYLLFEDRILYNRQGRISSHNLIGCIIRFIDKWEPLQFNLNSGVSEHRRLNREDYNSDLKTNAFGKIITPAQIIAQYLDTEGRKKLRQLIESEVQMYKSDGIITDKFATNIRNRVKREVRFKRSIPARPSSITLGKTKVI